jgi:hypothetical protein
MRRCGDFPFQGFLLANAYVLVKPLGAASHMNRNVPPAIAFLRQCRSGLCSCGGVKATPAWTISWYRPEPCTIGLILQRVRRGNANGLCASLGRMEAGHLTGVSTRHGLIRRMPERRRAGRDAWYQMPCLRTQSPLAALLPPRALSRARRRTTLPAYNL